MILFLEVRLDYKCLNNLSASGNIKNRQSYLLFAMLFAYVCVCFKPHYRQIWGETVGGQWLLDSLQPCSSIEYAHAGIKPQSLCLAVKQPVLPGSSPGCSLRWHQAGVIYRLSEQNFLTFEVFQITFIYWCWPGRYHPWDWGEPHLQFTLLTKKVVKLNRLRVTLNFQCSLCEHGALLINS